MADRLRFVQRLLDAMATRREVIEALMSRPAEAGEVDARGNPKIGGLGLSRVQAETAYQKALGVRGDEFRDEQTRARSEQGARLRAELSAAFRAKNFAAVARLEALLGKLYGTFAPTRVRVESDDRRDAMAGVLAGMTDEEIARVAGEGGDDEDE